ncbi:MAG: leucyl/phenylalanyl-tRNA--protein transferase [Fimbriimonadaceae bacterium]
MQVEPLTTDLLRLAYSQGIFPMGLERGEIGWFRSDPRAIFKVGDFHVSRSLRKRIATCGWRISFDENFEAVMRGCLRPEDNWITEELIQVYSQAHKEGWAHSCEVWSEGELIGGVYGLAIGSCFCAESMFHRRTDASKVGLWALVTRCCVLGFTLFDAQVMNPHLASLGAEEIALTEYLDQLREAMTQTTDWSRG